METKNLNRKAWENRELLKQKEIHNCRKSITIIVPLDSGQQRVAEADGRRSWKSKRLGEEGQVIL